MGSVRTSGGGNPLFGAWGHSSSRDSNGYGNGSGDADAEGYGYGNAVGEGEYDCRGGCELGGGCYG